MQCTFDNIRTRYISNDKIGHPPGTSPAKIELFYGDGCWFGPCILSNFCVRTACTLQLQVFCPGLVTSTQGMDPGPENCRGRGQDRRRGGARGLIISQKIASQKHDAAYAGPAGVVCPFWRPRCGLACWFFGTQAQKQDGHSRRARFRYSVSMGCSAVDDRNSNKLLFLPVFDSSLSH
jgi:hypothetical protein